MAPNNLFPNIPGAANMKAPDLWKILSVDLVKNIEKILHEANVLDFLVIADKHSLDPIRKQCLDIVRRKSGEIFAESSSSFKSILPDDLKRIINMINKDHLLKNDLKLKQTLCESLPVWSIQSKEHEESFPKILKCIRLEELSFEFLKKLGDMHLVQKYKTCRKIVDEAKEQSDSKRKLAENLPGPSTSLLNAAIKKDNEHSPSPAKRNRTTDWDSLQTKVYLIGGRDGRFENVEHVSEFNVSTGDWTKKKEIQRFRNHMAGAVSRKKIYLFGGYHNDRVYKDASVFDCQHNSWEALTDMPESRASSAAVYHDGYIYVSGGCDDNKRWLSTVIRYSILKKDWEEVKPMKRKRSGHQMVELNGCLYAIGGHKEYTIERFDPVIGDWEIVSVREDGESWFGAVVHKGKIFVLNSRRFYCFEYDNTFQRLPTPWSSEMGLQGIALISVNGKIWCVGGGRKNEGGKQFMSKYDPESNEWTELKDLDVGRKFHCAFVVEC